VLDQATYWASSEGRLAPTAKRFVSTAQGQRSATLEKARAVCLPRRGSIRGCNFLRFRPPLGAGHFAPKGPKNAAQGSALGPEGTPAFALKGHQKGHATDRCRPFRARTRCGAISQGAALGCVLPALRANRQVAKAARSFIKLEPLREMPI